MVIKRSFTVPPVPSHLEKWGARAPPMPAGSGATVVDLAVFSERELMFMFAICRRPSVCLSVVCLSLCLSVFRLSSVVCNVRAPYSGD